MAKSIYITGIGCCGKTVIAYGLLRKFKNKGLRVSYFKPISIARRRLPSGKFVDTDVLALKETLSLKEPIETISPVVLSERYLELESKAEQIKMKIEQSFQQISNGSDVVIIESYTYPEVLSTIGCSVPELARKFNSKVIFVVNCKTEDPIDMLVDRVSLYKCFLEKFGVQLHGVILNAIPLPYIERVKGFLAPSIKELGIKILGLVGERPKLVAPTVRDIVEALGAEVLEGEEYLDNFVEDILIGAMSPEAAIRWFRRATNAAIVTGGDRTDLIIQAIETKPSVVILTGNLYPAIGVLIRAKEAKVPILLVPYDTYTTVEKLREVQRIITSESLKLREKEIVDVIEKDVAWKEILDEIIES